MLASPAVRLLVECVENSEYATCATSSDDHARLLKAISDFVGEFCVEATRSIANAQGSHTQTVSDVLMRFLDKSLAEIVNAQGPVHSIAFDVAATVLTNVVVSLARFEIDGDYSGPRH